MDNALNYLSLARKAGLAELGEAPVMAATRDKKGILVCVAADASDRTWRQARDLAAGTGQQCLRLPYTKAQMGRATGRATLALAAFTDPSLALALVRALPEPEGAVLEALEAQAARQRQRQQEAKAHLRNKRKHPHPKKEH